MTKIVCIAEPVSAQEVAMIHLVLGESGIPYDIENEFYSQSVDGVTGLMDARMRLMVREEDAPKVLAMLRDARLRDDPDQNSH